jgi:hypothetical protein
LTAISTGQLTAQEQAALVSVGSRLEAILRAIENVLADAVFSPLPASRIAFATKARLRDPFDLAGALLYATEDHLRTIRLVITTGPLPSFALYTVLRAAAEAAVRARHLLDPSIPDALRLGRALNERLENLREQENAAADWRAELARRGTPYTGPSEEKHFGGRVGGLVRRALKKGLTPLRTRSTSGTPGRIRGFQESPRGAGELFALYLPVGAYTYRFLSGYGHSRAWTWMRQSKAVPSGTPGIGLVPTDLDVTLFSNILDSVLDLHQDNLRAMLNFAGYPEVVLAEALKPTGA